MSDPVIRTSKSGKRYNEYGRDVYKGDPIAKDSERFIVWEGHDHYSLTSYGVYGTFKQALRVAKRLQLKDRAVTITDRLIED